MKADYVLLEWSPTPKNAITLDELLNFEDDHWLHEGRALAEVIPSDVAITMDPERPRNTIPTDNLFNTDCLLVISERLKNFLEERKIQKLEYLPVAILDLKRKPIKPRYYIVNDCERVDCLDTKASKAKFSMIFKTQVSEVKRMVLDPKRIDPERQLFRLKNFDGPILVRRDLAQAMDQAKFTSIQWMELADYDGEA